MCFCKNSLSSLQKRSVVNVNTVASLKELLKRWRLAETLKTDRHLWGGGQDRRLGDQEWGLKVRGVMGHGEEELGGIGDFWGKFCLTSYGGVLFFFFFLLFFLWDHIRQDNLQRNELIWKPGGLHLQAQSRPAWAIQWDPVSKRKIQNLQFAKWNIPSVKSALKVLLLYYRTVTNVVKGCCCITWQS